MVTRDLKITKDYKFQTGRSELSILDSKECSLENMRRVFCCFNHVCLSHCVDTEGETISV